MVSSVSSIEKKMQCGVDRISEGEYQVPKILDIELHSLEELLHYATLKKDYWPWNTQ